MALARLACRDKKQITSLICTIYVPGHKGQSAPPPSTPPSAPHACPSGRACLCLLPLLAALLRLLLHFSARFVCARAEFVNFCQHQMQRVLQIHKKDSKRQKALKQKPEKCPQRLEVAASEHERSLQGERGEGREAKQQSSDYKGASVGKAQQIHTK